MITASSAMEYAFEGDRLADDHSRRPSVFTTALVEGLATGDADRDEDGWVSLNELYDYVFDRVREKTPHQTPSRDIEMQGELYLARSRRRRIHPLPIPPDLHAAMTDPNMFARIGAVSELRTRLASDNLPAAAGAHDALAEIARADIQYVAEAAAAALREAAVHTVERELHFGQVARDSSPAHRTIHLLGPPLARACTFQASANWIRVDQTTEGLDVSVDTSRVGMLRGVIALTAPTGEAVITVDVEVTPSPPQPPPITKPSPSRGEPSDNRAPASTPTRNPQPDEPSARSAPQPTPEFPSPLPAAPAQPRTDRPRDTRAPTRLVPGDSATPPVTRGSNRLGIRHVLWALIPVLSIGFLTPVPLVHAAVRLHNRKLWLITSAYVTAWVPLLILAITTDSVTDALYGALAVVATVHALLLRHGVFAEPSASPPPTEL